MSYVRPVIRESPSGAADGTSFNISLSANCKAGDGVLVYRQNDSTGTYDGIAAPTFSTGETLALENGGNTSGVSGIKSKVWSTRLTSNGARTITVPGTSGISSVVIVAVFQVDTISPWGLWLDGESASATGQIARSNPDTNATYNFLLPSVQGPTANDNYLAFVGTQISDPSTSAGYSSGPDANSNASGLTRSAQAKTSTTANGFGTAALFTRTVSGRNTAYNYGVTYTTTTSRQRQHTAHTFLIRGRVNTANGWGIDYTKADASAGGVSGSNDRSSTSMPWPVPIQASPGGRSQNSTVIVMPNQQMRYEMKPPSSFSVSEHLLNENEFYPGDDRYFGQAFYLGSDFPMQTNGEFQVIEQLHGQPDNGSPVVAFEVRDGFLYMTGGANKPTNTSSGTSTNDGAYEVNLMPVSKNVWYNLIYRVVFGETQATSRVDVWMRDGAGTTTQLLNNYQPACATIYPPTATVTNGGATYRKFGLYHRNTLAGGTIYQSGIKQGATFASVDPWQQTSTSYAGESSLLATAAMAIGAPSLTFRPTASINAAAAISTAANVGSQAPANSLLATAAMSATAQQTHSVLVALRANESTLVAQPFVTVQGVSSTMSATAAMLARAAYAGASLMSATASAAFTAYAVRNMAAMVLSSYAALEASATVLPALYVLMYSSGYLEAEPNLIMVSSANLPATATAVFDGIKETTGEALLNGTSSLSTNAVLRMAMSFKPAAATASLTLAQPTVKMNIALTPFNAQSNLTVRFAPENYQLAQIFYAPAAIEVGIPKRDLAAVANLSAESTFGNPDVFDASGLIVAYSAMTVAQPTQRMALSYVFGATAAITAQARLNQWVYETLVQTDSLQSSMSAEARISVPGEIILNVPAKVVVDPYVYTPIFVEPKGKRVRQTKLPTMRLYVFDTITGRVGWELPYSSLSWNCKLNSTGSASATIVIEAVLDALYAQGYNDPIRTFREFLTGPYRFSLAVVYGNTVVWAGPFLPSSDDSNSPTIDIQGVEIEKIFEHRILINPGNGSVSDPSRDVKFQSSGARGQIFRVVEHATNGVGRKLPIICSDPPLLRGQETVTYNSYDLVTVAKALEEIVTADNGPDLRFDPFLIEGSDGLYVNWDMKIGDPYLEYSQKWTWDDADIALSRDTDAVGLSTYVYAPGSGQDRSKLVGQAYSDYLTMLGFPVLEKVEGNNTSATEQRDLDSYAGASVRAGQTPTQKWSMKVPRDGLQSVGMYRVGDPVGIDVRQHPTIEHGYYNRRIVEIGGDASDLVSIVCDSDAKEMSIEQPIIIGAALPPALATRWGTGLVNEGSLDRADFWRSTTPVINSDSSWYRGNSLRINMPADGASTPAVGAVAPSGGFQSAHMQPAISGATGETLGYFKEGSTGSFGISFVLLPGYPVDSASFISIMQLDDWEGYSDALLQLATQNGRLCIRGLRSNNVYWDLGPVQAGRRYDVVIQANFSIYANRSIISAWVDGIPAVIEQQFGGSLLYSNSIGDFWLVGMEKEGSIAEAASIEYGAFAYDRDPRAVLAYLAQT